MTYYDSGRLPQLRIPAVFMRGGTSKGVVASRSPRADNDVDYLFGAVSVDRPVIDWSGNCGNLSAAVGPFAIHSGLVAVPPNGIATVRIWQVSIRRQILARFRWPTAKCRKPVS